ncbi:MAG: carboxypeptidase regulatory-like domain-containing protein, partial [Planctomycetes bacterium]|nr:carboxypeptidase regulatory-like domain-containing protein [Planctomycetota bacterium]
IRPLDLARSDYLHAERRSGHQPWSGLNGVVNEGGRLLTPRLLPGAYRVLASHPLQGLACVWTTVEHDEVTDVAARLIPGVSLAGRVRDDRDEAVEGAKIEIRFPAGDVLVWTTTTSSGDYELSGLPRGQDLDLFIGQEAHFETHARHRLEASSNRLDFVLQRRRTPLELRVTRNHGGPAEGIYVSLKSITGKGRRHQGRTNADGQARMEGIPAGTYDCVLKLAIKGHSVPRVVASRRVTLPTAESLEFVVADSHYARGRVTGRLSDSLLREAAGQAITVRLVSSVESDRVERSVIPDLDGRFTFGSLLTGSYTLMIIAGRQVIFRPMVTVHTDQDCDLGLIVEAQRGKLTLRFPHAGYDGQLIKISQHGRVVFCFVKEAASSETSVESLEVGVHTEVEVQTQNEASIKLVRTMTPELVLFLP